jgi:hypothetical protein
MQTDLTMDVRLQTAKLNVMLTSRPRITSTSSLPSASPLPYLFIGRKWIKGVMRPLISPMSDSRKRTHKLTVTSITAQAALTISAPEHGQLQSQKVMISDIP